MRTVVCVLGGRVRRSRCTRLPGRQEAGRQAGANRPPTAAAARDGAAPAAREARRRRRLVARERPCEAGAARRRRSPAARMPACAGRPRAATHRARRRARRADPLGAPPRLRGGAAARRPTSRTCPRRTGRSGRIRSPSARPRRARRPPRFVGLLRGRDALVLLDASLHEIARVPAPAAAHRARGRGDGGSSSRASSRGQSRTTGSRATRSAPPSGGSLGDARRCGLRDVALGHAPRGRRGVRRGRARRRALRPVALCEPLARRAERRQEPPRGRGRLPRRARRDPASSSTASSSTRSWSSSSTATACPATRRAPTIRHDGPIWGFDAAPAPDGGPPHRGRRRRGPPARPHRGSFGFVDSFVFLYRVPPQGPSPSGSRR